MWPHKQIGEWNPAAYQFERFLVLEEIRGREHFEKSRGVSRRRKRIRRGCLHQNLKHVTTFDVIDDDIMNIILLCES